ncbi:tRNA transferase Trm5/Tyw2 [Penicillium sp. DV-2018c]|nr:tRNA transferase Trm5/Tyw2 [Penicillium sp. DV-2018c]
MESTGAAPEQASTMFRPPVNRLMTVLDRSFFRTSVPLAAARIFKPSDVSNVRKDLLRSKDLLTLPRVQGVHEVKDETGQVRKALLLREDVKPDDEATWSPTINELVKKGTVTIGPFELVLDYDYWQYHDIISSILPEELLSDVPHGFTQVGHVLHLNLREKYIPYSQIIADILMDKCPNVRTVIRKTEDVGSQSEFRTFPFELLAGENDLNVVQHEQNCEFRFDYARVYWNSRLETEHRRLVEKFQPSEMVCDVMAGVGPFAVPAGKKNIFVWANDLNPHGYEAMQDAVVRNRVQDFVTPFNQDGRDFIRFSAKALLNEEPLTVSVGVSNEKRRKLQSSKKPLPEPKKYTRPTIVGHYVMNLPAIAIEFLDAFPGLYAGREELFAPETGQKLPMIHVYCFSGNSEDEVDDHKDICERISGRLGYTITVDDCVGGKGDQDVELAIYNVRLVSPKKQYFCASFRLPREVAFRKV